MYIVLGIQEAHDASAALMIDGQVVAAAQEERFSGLKGDYGFPEKSVAMCLEQAGIESTQINEVVLASEKWNPVLTRIKRNANFSVQDWVREQEEYWKPTLLHGETVNYHDLFKDEERFVYDESYDYEGLLDGYMDAGEMEKMAEVRRQAVADRLGLPLSSVRTVLHEDCHTYYAYYASPLRGEVLALTAEGVGDYSNHTVSRMSEQGRVELLAGRENHLAHIYQYITLILGMKPNQHEYKVMGLAPYGNVKEAEKSYNVFKDVLRVDGLEVKFDQKPQDLYFSFRDALQGHRFDGIAAGLQQFTEELLCEWTLSCIRETGLNRVVFSGGVAQNIKAVKAVMELPEVEDMFVCPAAGDTSLPIGACYYATWQHLQDNDGDVATLRPMSNVYFGPSYDGADARKAISEFENIDQYTVIEGVTPEEVAKRIADGMIVARCCGRMEFGLRALGNRSLIADPRDPDTVRRINEAIKFRDFWMPFTPSVLRERAEDYIENPKGFIAPFMTAAFNSTELGRRHLAAALHPADFTVRPQLLEEQVNPEYYALIKAFEKETGVGAVLNTSLNLHGDPIALGPKEALYILEKSDVDALLLEDCLVIRNREA